MNDNLPTAMCITYQKLIYLVCNIVQIKGYGKCNQLQYISENDIQC